MNSNLFRIGYPENSPLYFMGGGVDVFYVLTRNTEIDDLYGKHYQGYIFIDEIPKENVLKNIKYIRFDSDYGEVIEKLPSWIYEVQHIKALSISIDLLTNEELVNSNLFQNLETLELMHSNNDNTMIDIDCAKLPNLKRLLIMAYNHRLINTECLKNIEVFSINLEDRAKDELGKIKFLSQVKILQLESISTKLDLSPLSELKPTGLSVKFNFHKKQSLLSIINRSELEYLFINNMAMPIDFEVFADAKNLKEITIWNSKKFENIAAIGNIKSLKALDISYCKLNLTEEERTVVEKMNLEAFKIV